MNRNAGLLLPVTSLPSAYGIGDLGAAAKQFADLLQKSGQKVWQILPLNPISSSTQYSPYASASAMAGNILLIDPEWFATHNLLSKREIVKYKLSITPKVNYEGAKALREDIFQLAYEAFTYSKHDLLAEFRKFCRKEKYWLDSYSTYTLLQQLYKGAAWNEWPDRYATGNIDALHDLAVEKKNQIDKIKWLQFVFYKQWTELKMYCNDRNISIIGDMPFYMSVDSADVWANRHLFNIDRKGVLTKSAGVPPDYFSEEGQLWGMPTYKWNKNKEDNYSWWIGRLRKAAEYYDVIRLDHFRAFEAYWEVPAGQKNAIKGKWLPGPRTDLFDMIKVQLGELPIIAEDLGDNMDDVYKFRDTLGLPGMKILQFAFGDNMPESVDIPHNYTENCIVYTGTHDNNTVKGWYTKEIDEATKERIAFYIGHNISVKNIHTELVRLAYSSIAKTAIIPVQDILGLPASARVNTPGTNKGNWTWRLLPDQLDKNIAQYLSDLASTFGRV